MNCQRELLYFDWAAASLVRRDAAAVMSGFPREMCCNPESLHPGGMAARKIIADAAARLSLAVLGREASAAWGGSGTELFRLAAAAAALYEPRKRVLMTDLEHPAAAAQWRTFPGGCRILPPGQLAENADGDTGFVIISRIQSVLGVLLPAAEIIAEVRRRSPEAVIFADTIQSACRYSVPAGCDLCSVSAAKLGSPAGGAAWIAVSERGEKFLKLFATLRSRDYIAGRAEPLQAACAAAAAEEQRREREDEYARVCALNSFVRKELEGYCAPNGKLISGTIPADEASPWILHLFFPGYQSAVLLRMLAKEGICVSAGSACQAETDQPDSAMTGWGFKKNDAFSGLRISFGFSSNIGETEVLVKKIKEILQNY